MKDDKQLKLRNWFNRSETEKYVDWIAPKERAEVSVILEDLAIVNNELKGKKPQQDIGKPASDERKERERRKRKDGYEFRKEEGPYTSKKFRAPHHSSFKQKMITFGIAICIMLVIATLASILMINVPSVRESAGDIFKSTSEGFANLFDKLHSEDLKETVETETINESPPDPGEGQGKYGSLDRSPKNATTIINESIEEKPKPAASNTGGSGGGGSGDSAASLPQIPQQVIDLNEFEDPEDFDNETDEGEEDVDEDDNNVTEDNQTSVIDPFEGILNSTLVDCWNLYSETNGTNYTTITTINESCLNQTVYELVNITSCFNESINVTDCFNETVNVTNCFNETNETTNVTSEICIDETINQTNCLNNTINETECINKTINQTVVELINTTICINETANITANQTINITTCVNDTINITNCFNETNETTNVTVEVCLNETIDQTSCVNETINATVNQTINITNCTNTTINQTVKELVCVNETVLVNESVDISNCTLVFELIENDTLNQSYVESIEGYGSQSFESQFNAQFQPTKEDDYTGKSVIAVLFSSYSWVFSDDEPQIINLGTSEQVILLTIPEEAQGLEVDYFADQDVSIITGNAISDTEIQVENKIKTALKKLWALLKQASITGNAWDIDYETITLEFDVDTAQGPQTISLSYSLPKNANSDSEKYVLINLAGAGGDPNEG